MELNKLNKDTVIKYKDKLTLGKNIKIGKNTKEITIGYGCYIGDNVYIDVPNLTIGDYVSIHTGITIHGYKNCSIGHNCWFGQYTVVDSIGGTSIGNNVGVGAHSQLWSHIKFGDTTEGCRWNSTNKLILNYIPALISL